MFTISVGHGPHDWHRPDNVTAISIEVNDWGGNRFGLWLPEFIEMDGRYAWANWNHNNNTWPEGETDGGFQEWVKHGPGTLKWSMSFADFDFVAELIRDDDNACLWYNLFFANTSDRVLHRLNAITCFHVVNAPQFISVDGERIWLCLDGKWTTSDKVERSLSPDPRRVSFMKKGLRSERTVVPNHEWPSAIMPEEACHPLIICESFDRKASVGTAVCDFEKLFNNNDTALRCIHSNPAPLKTIDPGQTGKIEGIIMFLKGDHQAMLGHFEKLTCGEWS